MGGACQYQAAPYLLYLFRSCSSTILSISPCDGRAFFVFVLFVVIIVANPVIMHLVLTRAPGRTLAHMRLKEYEYVVLPDWHSFRRENQVAGRYVARIA